MNTTDPQTKPLIGQSRSNARLGVHLAHLDTDGFSGKYILECLACGKQKLGCGACKCGCYVFEKIQVTHNTAMGGPDGVPYVIRFEHLPNAKVNGETEPTTEHTCHWPGCSKVVSPAMWGCKAHWLTLPNHLRNMIWATYKPGQEITKTPSAAYLAAACEVQEWILKYGRS